MSELLVIVGLSGCAISGLAGLFFGRRTCVGQWVSTVIAVIGCGLGLAGVGVFWSTRESTAIRWPWPIPGAEFNVAMDGLSAIFLVPIFLISLLGSVYGLGYWKQTEHPQNGRKLRLFYGTLTAGMALLVIARNSILFLFGWEIMALSAFFLVTTEDHDRRGPRNRLALPGGDPWRDPVPVRSLRFAARRQRLVRPGTTDRSGHHAGSDTAIFVLACSASA